MAKNAREQPQPATGNKAFTSEQQEYIVDRFACCAKASQVQEDVKAIFGIDASLPRLLYYNPTKPQGFKLEAHLKMRFETMRKAYLADAAAVPCYHLAYRLHFLQGMIEDESNERNPFLLKDLLKQAAQDSGGQFTNRKEITGPGGKPIIPDEGARNEAAKELDAWRKQMLAQVDQDLNAPE